MHNIILIPIGSVRADHLGCMGYKRETSPNLDKMAKNGALFTNAYSNGPVTSSSFPTILTSVYSSISSSKMRLSSNARLISQELKERGYSTGALHSNPYLSRYYGYDRGFDTFDDCLFDSCGVDEKLQAVKADVKNYEINSFGNQIRCIKEKLKKIKTLTFLYNKWRKTKKRLFAKRRVFQFFAIAKKYANGRYINKKALDWMNNKNNFFLWVHYMDVHVPYIPEEKYMKKINVCNIPSKEIDSLNKKLYEKPHGVPVFFSQDEIDDLEKLYDASIRQVDELIGQFFNKLNDVGLLKDTTIIVTSDHGDEFNEHGGFAHPHKLYDELIHVPLILYGKKIAKGKKVEGMVELMNISPTILDLLELERNPKFLGDTLLLSMKDKNHSQEYVISEIGEKVSIRSKRWKLIKNKNNTNYELYDIENDPLEKNNVSNQNIQIVKELDSKIEEIFKNAKYKWMEVKEECSNLQSKREKILKEESESKIYGEEDEEKIKERLRDLGYQ